MEPDWDIWIRGLLSIISVAVALIASPKQDKNVLDRVKSFIDSLRILLDRIAKRGEKKDPEDEADNIT